MIKTTITSASTLYDWILLRGQTDIILRTKRERPSWSTSLSTANTPQQYQFLHTQSTTTQSQNTPPPHQSASKDRFSTLPPPQHTPPPQPPSPRLPLHDRSTMTINLPPPTPPIQPDNAQPQDGNRFAILGTDGDDDAPHDTTITNTTPGNTDTTIGTTTRINYQSLQLRHQHHIQVPSTILRTTTTHRSSLLLRLHCSRRTNNSI